MFVVSLSGSLFKKIAVPVVVVGVITLVCTFARLSETESIGSTSAIIVNGADASTVELKSFIASYGWTVAAEPDEVREVLIPAEFDAVYNNYNSIQLAQGYDLAPLKGQRVKRWTYTILNYPGYETEDCVKINILVYNSCVVGGDVCSVKLDGFMHGFEKE
ncbi:MAG: DUF4830 domain-containing protein [Clostridia bacterium]|nr:DUF4830 domain-containing protein [Clostridia bacterium]